VVQKTADRRSSGRLVPVIEIDEYTPEVLEKFAAKCARGIPNRKYDEIHFDSDEGGRLVAAYEQDDSAEGSELVANPALPFFEANIIELGEKSKVVYVPSALPRVIEITDDGKHTAIPLVDAFIYQTVSDGEPDAVVSIGTFEYQDTASGERVFGTQQQVKYTNPYSQLGWHVRNELKKLSPPMRKNNGNHPELPHILDWQREIKLLYVAVQYALKNRPTLFREKPALHRLPPESGSKSKSKRKVKTYRIYTLDAAELANLPERGTTKRTVTCPSWGVIGHKRRLKNGKEIWVKPYRKGKDRDNPESYSPKQYDLVTEGNNNA